MVHRVASAYGKWPHEVLGLDPEQLGLALSCVQAADRSRAAMIKASKAWPMFLVGGGT